MREPTALFPDPAGEVAWRAAVAKVLNGADPESLIGRTADGIAVAPLSPAAEAPGPSGARLLLAVMPRLDGTAADAADELANGADGLALVVAQSSSARGFGIDLAGLDAALAGVDLAQCPIRIDPALFGGLDALHALLELARARNVAPSALDLDAGLDPLGAIACGKEPPLAWPTLATYLAEGVRVVRDSGIAGPVIRADGVAHHEAGATEAQELAAVLASAVAYLRALDRAGSSLETIRSSLSFQLVADADEMLTIAKFRALRRLWAYVEEACGLSPAPIRLHAETSWRMMTRRDPHTNLLRTTLACAGAILGGADSVTVLPFTLPLGLPDGFARRLARNTALVLRDEAGLDRVGDPAAGSGTFEGLTDALCAEAWDLFQTVEAGGGLGAALAGGSWRARIETARERRRAELRDGRRRIVGTTVFALADEGVVPVAALPPPRTALSGAALGGLRDDEMIDQDGGVR